MTFVDFVRALLLLIGNPNVVCEHFKLLMMVLTLFINLEKILRDACMQSIFIIYVQLFPE